MAHHVRNPYTATLDAYFFCSFFGACFRLYSTGLDTEQHFSDMSLVTSSQAPTSRPPVSSGHRKVGSTTSAKDARQRKGLSTDRFFSRLLGNGGANNASAAGPPTAPPIPLAAPPKKSSAHTAVVNVTKTTRRKALSMVVEPLSGKIGSNSANRAHRKSVKVGSPMPIMSATASQTSDHSRRARGGSVVTSPTAMASGVSVVESLSVPSQKRTSLSGQKKAERTPKDTSPILSATSTTFAPDYVSQGLGVDEDEEMRRRETSSASPNWSHRTTANTSLNSTSQMSSSSKAKRVMDWFRFKSLNTSSSSTHQSVGQVNGINSAGPPMDGPSPITTDFDVRRKGRESKIGIASGSSQATARAPSNGSNSTRDHTHGDETITVVSHHLHE